MTHVQGTRAIGLVTAVITLGGLLACVGSESDRRPEEREQAARSESETVPPASRSAADADTITPLRYEIFETERAVDDPNRALYRLLVMEQSPRLDALLKTVRLALDSIAGSDTNLLAARAILYTFRPIDRRQGTLIPRIWGEWVPPEGWHSAGAVPRQRLRRSYLYSANPGWTEAEPQTNASRP